MATFIKGGVWSKRKNIPKILNGELNLDELIAQQSVPGIQGPTGAQGVPGSQGIPGTAGAVGPAGLTWRSSWVSGTSYIANDAVAFGGASYFCILATSGTSNPTVATSNWALLASQGAQGIQGIQGLAGATGAQGNTGPAGVASQTLQQTVDLGNTFRVGANFATLAANNISFGTDGSYTTTYGPALIGVNLGSNYQILEFPTTLTGGVKTISLPNATGTIALTSDITLQNAVNGGNTITSGVDVNTLSADRVTISGASGNSIIYGNGTVSRSNSNSGGTLLFRFPTNLASGTRQIILPDASGTVALTVTKTNGLVYGPDTTGNVYTTLPYDFNQIAEGVGNKFKLPATTSSDIGKEVVIYNFGNNCVIYTNDIGVGIQTSVSGFTNQKSVVYNDFVKFTCTGANVWQMSFLSAVYPTLNGKNLVAYTGAIYTYSTNATTSALSLATLNSTYPNASTILEYKVYCPNISGGGLVYIKTGAATWVSSSITTVI